jgi:hypothetical protein
MEFGYRYVMALSIRDQGFNCPEVKDVQDVGYEWEGVVMKVTCGPFGAQAAWADRPLRVTAYTDGDYTTTRWHEPKIDRSAGSVSNRIAPAIITQNER